MPCTMAPSFICELPLVLVGNDERRLRIRLDCARQIYNAVLGESLKRLSLLRQSKAFQAAHAMPKQSKEQQRERAAAFRALDVQFRLREYDLHAYATRFSCSWLGKHLDANTIQTIPRYSATLFVLPGARGASPRLRCGGRPSAQVMVAPKPIAPPGLGAQPPSNSMVS